MSDGPYKSLNMRPGWKKVAEIAEKPAFPLEDVGANMDMALSKDCRLELTSELIKGLQENFMSPQQILFPEEIQKNIEILRNHAKGHPLAFNLVDNLEYQINNGAMGWGAVKEAMVNTLIDHTKRSARQVEEHYFRDPDRPRAVDVRERMKEGLKLVSFFEIVNQTLGIETKKNEPPASKKKGLDDGVQL